MLSLQQKRKAEKMQTNLRLHAARAQYQAEPE